GHDHVGAALLQGGEGRGERGGGGPAVEQWGEAHDGSNPFSGRASAASTNAPRPGRPGGETTRSRVAQPPDSGRPTAAAVPRTRSQASGGGSCGTTTPRSTLP